MSLRFAQLVVCSNQAHALPRALDSVLAQSVLPDEIVVGDDGSRDDSADVIEEYARRHPKRVRAVLLPEPRGGAALRNACALASGAELLSVLEADEELLPGKLEAELSAVHAYYPGYEAYYSSYRVVDAQSGQARTEPRRPRDGGLCLEIARGRLRPRNYLFSRRLYAEIGGFDERLGCCAQWKLELELSLRTRMRYVPGVRSVCPERAGRAQAGDARALCDCVATVCADLRRRHGLLPRERRALEAARRLAGARAAGGVGGLAGRLLAFLADPLCRPSDG